MAALQERILSIIFLAFFKEFGTTATAVADLPPAREACANGACTDVAVSKEDIDTAPMLQVVSRSSPECPPHHLWRRAGLWMAKVHLRKIHPMVAQYVSAAKANSSKGAEWHPAVREFYGWVMNTSVQRMSFTIAIEETNLNPCTPKPPMFSTISELFQIINHVVTSVSPSFSNPDTDGLVGCPLNAVLDWMMWTPQGVNLFRDAQVNAHFNRILSVWGRFLDGPDSREFLTHRSPHGWYSVNAKPFINMSEYVVQLPNDPHKYFSWNAFFTRKFKPGMRPVESPKNSKVIVSGCESTPLFMVTNGVKRRDRFWLKTQPYSLQDIFTSNDTLAGTDTTALAELFEGGSLYQAFLSATNYHCWHSPVDGTIEYLYTVPGGIGTYYSELFRVGFDSAGPDKSQGYLTSVAVRMIFIIRADDTSLGRVAVVQVGMAEVSSVDALVKKGDKVKKGDIIGQFKFGGSTFVNIFQPGVIKKFVVEEDNLVRLNTRIAIAN